MYPEALGKKVNWKKTAFSSWSVQWTCLAWVKLEASNVGFPRIYFNKEIRRGAAYVVFDDRSSFVCRPVAEYPRCTREFYADIWRLAPAYAPRARKRSFGGRRNRYLGVRWKDLTCFFFFLPLLDEWERLSGIMCPCVNKAEWQFRPGIPRMSIWRILENH